MPITTYPLIMYSFFSQKKQTQAKVSYNIIVVKNVIPHTRALKNQHALEL